MFSAGTQFKQPAGKFRKARKLAGRDPIQVYNDARSYKLSPPVLGLLQTSQS